MTTLKQPSSVYYLSFTEIWERYGFYCVQSLIIIYLSRILKFSDDHAYSLYSAFIGLLYASPVIGGFLADRVLGFQKAIIFGTLLYIAGYAIMLIDTSLGFYLSLSFLVCGMGYFKANISSLLGTVYDTHDPRRDSGFTIFYLGINIGSFLGPIIGSLVAIHFGYRLGFATSSIGMLIGLATFLKCRHHLASHGLLPLGLKTAPKTLSRWQLLTYLFTLGFTLLLCFLLPFDTVINYFILVFTVAAIFYILYHTIKIKSVVTRKKIFALLILFVFSIIFWAYYMLFYSVLTLFAERCVNRFVFGWKIPAAMLSSLGSLSIIILCPFAAKLWIRIDQSPWNPSYGLKFAFGLFFQGISFAAIILGIYFHSTTYQVGLIWIVLFTLLRTIGELALSPIGLAAVTELSPKELVGTMMGIWFLTIAGGVAFSDNLANVAAITTTSMQPLTELTIYRHAFVEYSWALIAASIVLLLITPLLKQLTTEKEM